MSTVEERYMQARLALDDAVQEFREASQKVGFDQDSIASSIMDSFYDYDREFYYELRSSLLPMVEKFRLTASLESEHMFKDWDKALLEWDQRRVWRALHG